MTLFVEQPLASPGIAKTRKHGILSKSHQHILTKSGTRNVGTFKFTSESTLTQ